MSEVAEPAVALSFLGELLRPPSIPTALVQAGVLLGSPK